MGGNLGRCVDFSKKVVATIFGQTEASGAVKQRQRHRIKGGMQECVKRLEVVGRGLCLPSVNIQIRRRARDMAGGNF